MIDIKHSPLQKMLECKYALRLLEKLDLVNLANCKNSKTAYVIDIHEVKKAILYAKYYHANQKRDSGEPFYSHPLEVAYMVSDYIPKTDIIITAILHDTIEDTTLTKTTITKVFNQKIAEQVYDLTRIQVNGIKITSAELIKNLWIQQKYDLILIKILDRLHNISTLKVKTKDKIKKTISETLSSFCIIIEIMERPDLYDKILFLCNEISESLELINHDNPFDKPFSLSDSNNLSSNRVEL